MDKLFIKGHYYSDKSPVPALAMAGVYKALQVATGLRAAEKPQSFCYLLALIFSGVAYVISVYCIDAMAATMDLSCKSRLILAWSFALATVALPYARQVNNHIMLLAVCSALMLTAVSFTQPGGDKSWRLFAIGSLAGAGYTIDLGVGPILVIAATTFIILQTKSWRSMALVLIAAFPWFLLHHLLNFRIGGTFSPANSVAAYFEWPGCPFTAQNLTGHWTHPDAWEFICYTIAMLFGQRGFIEHNIPLYLSIPAIVYLLRRKTDGKVLVCFALSLILGTWLIYAIASDNYSGRGYSIRWLVPLLAPFYYLLAAFLKERPEYSTDLLILAAWGLVAGTLMWTTGPWVQSPIPGFWFLQAGALASWLGWRWHTQRCKVKSPKACGN